MALETPILTNFTSGELSPRLDGRVDLARYYNGCRELTNFIVHPHGGASRRGGFRLAAAAGNPDKPSLLLAFEFNAEQAYVLEFFEDQSGAGKMRVFKDGGLVLAGDGAAYVLDSPYVQADFERIKARGAEFTAPPSQFPWGIMAMLDDTCGNLIQLTQLARW